jgi:hypothetical protein
MNSPEVKALIEAAEQVVKWFSKTTFKAAFTDLKAAIEAVKSDAAPDLNQIHQTVSNLRPEVANAWAEKLTEITSFGANPHWTHWYHLANASAKDRLKALEAVKKESNE